MTAMFRSKARAAASIGGSKLLVVGVNQIACPSSLENWAMADSRALGETSGGLDCGPSVTWVGLR